MTLRREIERHRRKLTEIRDIMDSMKMLAYMETHKLARFIEAQKKLVNNIEDVAIDFLQFYPEILPQIEPSAAIILLIGSQRGFCGDFNEILLKHFNTTNAYHGQHQSKIIAVGEKLHPQLQSHTVATEFIEGANVAEEISRVVGNIIDALSTNRQPLLSLQMLYHDSKNNGVVSVKLLPPFSHLNKKQRFSHPPVLNLSPEAFLLELTEHHLFIVLHRILYASLMVENQSRVQHLENGVHHLDDKTNELTRKSNALRQEEIIEEIEVILLNVSPT